MAGKSLEVKNLRISFRTDNGKVQAVRDVSFGLERGRTLAIVGESGSGKSVTSRAIMGILAGNAIVEGGEILFDGKDLLKINEDEMYRIRGDKISMIFQDPLSSLNPIMKIGKQITEAMLLKNKASRREARNEFNGTLALLKKHMIAAGVSEAQAKELAATFDKFCIEANRLEHSYNASDSLAEGMSDSLRDFLFRMSKHQKADVKAVVNGYRSKLKKITDPFYTAHYAQRMHALSEKLKAAAAAYKPAKKGGKGEIVLPEDLGAALSEIQNLLSEMHNQPRPDFFRIGYYSLANPKEQLSGRDVEALNQMTLEYLNEQFMNTFFSAAVQGVKHSYDQALAKKKKVLPVLAAARKYYLGDYDEKDALQYAKTLSSQVEQSIDRLETVKDSVAYTFRSSLTSAINNYFSAVKNDPKEEARFARQTKRYEEQLAKGKHIDWKVIPKSVHDLDELKREVVSVIDRLEARYQVAAAAEVDYDARCVTLIDYFKDKASKVVYKVTKAMAKERAIELMEEVGINEARMRYYQYPFEFSGGMRQRIVIAIALSADPEVLICDEPTTALDVTIQAQILELINDLKHRHNLSVIFITHDLGVVANMADDIAVMYAGKIVEYGTADDIFYDPRHPYTWALLSSMPDLDTKEKLDAIPGTPPNMIYPPVGDAFAERNKYALDIDFEQQPPMFEISETHKAATWLLHPDAPKVEMPKIISERIARMAQNAGGAQNG